MSVDERIRVAVRVSGLVQGVFYRASTVERAQDLALVGWVRNRQDGSVELEAEGASDAVWELVRWCQTGPPGARVDDLKTERREASGAERSFVVRPTE